MCGISGVVVKNRCDFNLHVVINEMIGAQAHRGPDSQDFRVFQDGLAIGHNRLAIIDLTIAGSQPMEKNNCWIVFNGEVNNFKELRIELQERGVKFKSESDTEVVLAGFIEFGQAFFKRLDGMFAFAIYDASSKELILVRDHFGVKPLFIYEDEDILVFASEIKAIKKVIPKSKLTINHSSLEDVCRFLYIRDSKTIYREIQRLESATIFNFSLVSGLRRKETYWKLNRNGHYLTDKNHVIDRITELLKNSVKNNLISDVPIGIFLSGGIDSSLLLGMATEYQNTPIDTFCIAFNGLSKYFDESQYARRLAQKYKSNHHELDYDFFNDKRFMDFYILNLDEPLADPSMFLNYIVSEYSVSTTKVVLSGLGGDELFGGYNRYKAYSLARKLRVIPSPLRKFLVYWTRKLPENRSSFSGDLIRGFNKIINDIEWDSWGTYDNIVRYDNGEFSTTNVKSNLYEDLNDLMQFDIENYMVNDLLSLTDSMSMLNSQEVRVPFLNRELMEFAMCIHPNLKVNMFNQKLILKKLAEKYMDKDMIYRKKQGFTAPIFIWFERLGENNTRDIFFGGTLCEYIEKSYIERVIKGFFQEKKDYSLQLYSLYVISSWLSNKEF